MTDAPTPEEWHALNDHVGALYSLTIHAFTILHRLDPHAVERLLIDMQARQDRASTPEQVNRMGLEAEILEKAIALLDPPAAG